MLILHICSVENKMSNGATVAALNHVNEQAKTSQAQILVCHVRDEQLPWDERVVAVPFAQLRAKASEADLVVFHEIYYMPFFKIAGWLRQMRVPYVVVAHGGLTAGAQSQRRLPKSAVNLLWAKKFVSGARAVHFLSDREYTTSMRWNPAYMIAPNGVHIPSECKSYEGQKDGVELIYIGRINLFYKGLDILCEACGAARERLLQERIHISIYGPREGADYEQLMSLIQQNQLEDIITVKDGVFGADKINTMLGADAFIQPSRSEGQPMGILDAMAVGLPVIVTPGTSFDGLVERYDCGWVCDCDKTGLAETLLQVGEQRDLLPDKSAHARTCAAEEFEWSQVASRTLAQYEALIEK